MLLSRWVLSLIVICCMVIGNYRQILFRKVMGNQDSSIGNCVSFFGYKKSTYKY